MTHYILRLSSVSEDHVYIHMHPKFQLMTAIYFSELRAKLYQTKSVKIY